MKTSLFLLILSISSSAMAACPTITTPKEFEVNERAISWGTDMTLIANGESFGKIKERTFNATSTFELLNERSELVARAKKRLLSWGTQIDIKDCEGKKIGSVKEKIFANLIGTTYEVYDAAGKQVGKSKKVTLINTDITVTSMDGDLAFKMHRRAMRIWDSWNITTGTTNSIDPRLVLMTPAFKTASDNSKAD